MKKALALLLALVMCLSLVACGENKTTEEKGMEAAETIDTITSETLIEEVIPEVHEDLIATYPLLAGLLGEWKSISHVQEDDPFQETIIINDDGTCMIDGKNGLWQVDTGNTAEGRVCISIHVDGTHIGSMMYWDNNKSISIIHTSFYFSPASWEKADVTESSEPAYETVEITMENWPEYFEFRLREGYWREDAFGESTEYSSSVIFTIKDEYIDIVNQDTIDIAFSYSYVNQYWYYEADFDSKTLTIRELVSEELLREHSIFEGVSSGIAMTSTESPTVAVYFYKDSPLYTDINGTEILKIDAVDIDRIQGTIEIQAN